MTDLRFGVLGPLEVVRDGRPVAVPGRRRAVLACLLVNEGRPVSADVLIEAAWRDDLPVAPRAALHTVLSRLRATVGVALVSDVAGYVLDVGQESVDAQRFESLRTRAKTATAQDSARLLGEALALWRGAAYEEFIDHDFAAAEAQRLERARVDAREELATVLMATGQHGPAIAELESLLGEHPFREHAVELLMTALYRAGRQADALARYREYRVVLREELALDPSPSVSDLESRILGHAVPANSEAIGMDGPRWWAPSTAFFGRESTRGDLVAAVASDRLVTVTGVGGVGKTRLVAEVLPALRDELRTPVTVVELASVQPRGVWTAVADALGLETEAGAVNEEVLEYLSVGRHLVVLDNCEHLRAEVANFADTVTRRCPGVRLLATSRHRLVAEAERVVPLPPLPADPGVRLFVDRVSRLRPSFELTPENVGPVFEICRRLDGLPLGLELAASRAATLGVETVARLVQTAPVDDSLRDLRSIVEWSVRLLSTEQRRLLAHLSVFAGGFTVEDAVALARTGPKDRGADVISALEELVEANLLANDGRGDEPNLRMLALVRSFASRELTGSGDAESVHLAHARWVCASVEEASRFWISGSAAAADERLTSLGADMNAALRWLLHTDRLDVAASITGSIALCLHWLPGVELAELVLEVAQRCIADAPGASRPGVALGLGAGAMTSAVRGDLERTRLLAGAALESAQSDQARFLASLALGVATFHSGEHDESMVWLDRAADLPGVAVGHRVEPRISLALLACEHGDIATARASVAVAMVGSEASGAEASRAFARYASGEIEVHNDPGRGEAQFRAAADEAGRIGAAHISHVSSLALLAVLVRRGAHHESLQLAVRLLQDVRRSGTWPQIWTTLRIAAELLAARGRREDVVFLLAAAEASPTAPPLVGEDVPRYAGLRQELQRHIGADVVSRIEALAASTPRSRVVDRTMTLLAGLR